jgi:branched-chain amino acid transport system substrate-binding protein
MFFGLRNKRTGALLAAVTASAAIVAGCGSSNDNGGGSNSESGGLKQGGTFKVGYAASETGRLAIFEQPFIKGLQMSVDEINAKGGIDGKVKVQLTIKDAKSDPSTGGVVAQDLISGGAQFLITACDADASLPASQLAQKNKVAVLNSCGSGSSLPTQVGDYQFMNVYGTEREGQAMAEFAKSEGYQKAYIMTSHDIEYTESMMKAAADTFKSQGGQVAGTAEFKLDQPRYTTQATQIANAKPDVVMTSMFLPASVTFLKNLRAAGYDGPVIGPDGQEGSETFSAGPAAKNLFVFTFGYPSDDAAGQSLTQWNKEYEQKYGKAPGTVIAALGGDAACLIDTAVTKANSTDPTKVRDAMANLTDASCPTGKITYAGQQGIPKKDVVVLKSDVAKKKFEFVKRFIPQAAQG